MKNKIVLFTILTGLTALLFALKKGVFNKSTAEYKAIKIPDIVDYNFHIKPILSDKCYTCHGPDATKRKANLRLDTEEEAYRELRENPGHFAIVSGKPNKSELYQRIISEDEALLMPPADAKLFLNGYEKKLIKKWIQQGAKFEKHWAYRAPVKAVLPKSEVVRLGT